LKDKLIKTGAKVVRHGRYVVFQMAEVAIARQRFCGSSRNCGRSRHQRRREALDGYAFMSNRQKECVQMPGKMARSDPRLSVGLPEVLVAVTPRVCLAKGSQNANIDAGFGFIWRISAQRAK
jgi:hypothetical protein